MAIWFKALFTNNGAPRTGLSPLPKKKKKKISDNSEVVSSKNMTEVGYGWYKYDFTSLYAAGEEYAAVADASSAIADPERYAYG